MKGRTPRAGKIRSEQLRRASAAVELALLLPALSSICVITVDYSRLFFMWTTISASAFDGVMFLSSASYQAASGYTSYQQAALADATNLGSSALAVSSSTGTTPGTDASNNKFFEVTVTYNFTTVFNYPGIPNAVTLTRTLRMLQNPS